MDAEKMLLATVREEKPQEQWLFQYRHAPLFLDQYTALEHLTGEPLRKVLLDALTNQESWLIRIAAIQAVSALSGDDREQVRNILVKLVTDDPKSMVRAAVTGRLSASFPKKDRPEEHTSELPTLMRSSYAL